MFTPDGCVPSLTAGAGVLCLEKRLPALFQAPYLEVKRYIANALIITISSSHVNSAINTFLSPLVFLVVCKIVSSCMVPSSTDQKSPQL